MLLTADDLAELTGKVRPAAQRGVLDFMEIPYRLEGGYLRVHRRDVIDTLWPQGAHGGHDKWRRESVAELWSRYVSELTAFHRVYKRGDALPTCSAIYLMIDDGAVHYVGQTVNLQSRIVYHRHAWWQELAVIEMPDWWPHDRRHWWLDGVEGLAMDYFTPTENVKKAYGRRGPDELLAFFDRMPESWRSPKS